jgi:hypothetical protein
MGVTHVKDEWACGRRFTLPEKIIRSSSNRMMNLRLAPTSLDRPGFIGLRRLFDEDVGGAA